MFITHVSPLASIAQTIRDMELAQPSGTDKTDSPELTATIAAAAIAAEQFGDAGLNYFAEHVADCIEEARLDGFAKGFIAAHSMSKSAPAVVERFAKLHCDVQPSAAVMAPLIEEATEGIDNYVGE